MAVKGDLQRSDDSIAMLLYFGNEQNFAQGVDVLTKPLKFFWAEVWRFPHDVIIPQPL